MSISTVIAIVHGIKAQAIFANSTAGLTERTSKFNRLHQTLRQLKKGRPSLVDWLNLGPGEDGFLDPADVLGPNAQPVRRHLIISDARDLCRHSIKQGELREERHEQPIPKFPILRRNLNQWMQMRRTVDEKQVISSEMNRNW
jgi:hypothetical protein